MICFVDLPDSFSWARPLALLLLGSVACSGASRAPLGGGHAGLGAVMGVSGNGGSGGGTSSDRPGGGGAPLDAGARAPDGAARPLPDGSAGPAPIGAGGMVVDASSGDAGGSSAGGTTDGGPGTASPTGDADAGSTPSLPGDGAGSSGAVVFTDVTAAAGLLVTQGPDDTSTSCGLTSIATCGSSMTGGVAVGDVDRDGFPDVYLTRMGAPGVLFHNRGDGSFEDVTAAAGLSSGSHSSGAAFGDLDGDGDLDLYVTTVGDSRFYLYVNDGSGRFTEDALGRGAALGDGTLHEGFGIGLGDYDRDGYLDLHACEWSLSSAKTGGSHSVLFHNVGSAAPGTFENVTKSAHVSMDQPTGSVFAFTSTFSDLDDDGWPDLAVVSDMNTSRLFWNQKDGTFRDGTRAAGVGTDNTGMGSAIGDYDGDGLLDWFVTAIDCTGPLCTSNLDGNRLYKNLGGRKFRDDTDVAGVRHGGWGWGAAFFDPDGDGDLDLVMTNGFSYVGPSSDLFARDPMRFWVNQGTSLSPRMVETSGPSGLTDRGDGRGLVVLDYDGDGDQDLLVAHHAGTPTLYRNDGGARGYLRVRLHGTQSNTDGIGAKITVTPRKGGPTLVREITVGGFVSQSEMVAHFGLGALTGNVAEVRIRWPRTGAEQVLTGVASNQTLDVVEP